MLFAFMGVQTVMFLIIIIIITIIYTGNNNNNVFTFLRHYFVIDFAILYIF